MDVWIVQTYGQSNDSPIIELYATWDLAYKRWEQLRQADFETFDEDPTEDPDCWEEQPPLPQSHGWYNFNTGDGWVFVELFKRTIAGLKGRNTL